MPVALICANCGRIYDLPEHLSYGPCVACQTINSRPQAEGESLDRLQRATRLRLEGNHGEALKCYEHVLVDYDDEHAALWGKLLCQYGVDYVTDPKTGVRHATVHVPRNRPMQLHADFSRACELAPEEVRAQYEADAAYVDEALAEINRHKESSPPYDVFICHKTTHLTGPGYTEDYNRGVQLTMLLTGMGYRVFFAPLSGLTPGAGYEAGIYYALWSARVMLLISSDAAFLTSPWVKSEWTRYLEMLDDGADKHLIPLMYDRLADGRMPREIRLRRLQSIRMDSDLDAKDKLLAAVAKFTGRETAATVKPEPVKPAPAKPEPVKPEPAKPEPAKPARPAPVQPEKVADMTPSVPDARTVPEQPERQEPQAAGCAPEKDFKTEAVEGGVSITGYTGPGGEVLIPPTIGGKQVVGIGEEAFKMQRSLTNLVFPEGVTSIGKRAFNFCSRLESVSIPESLVQLDTDGLNPFAHCPALKSITVAEGNRKYRVRDNVLLSRDRELLCYPAGLSAASYTIPDFVTSIAGLAFRCSKLKTVNIPESVTRIGAAAFSFSTKLTDVRIPTGVRSIEDMMFLGCGALASVSIPEHVTHIGDWAFKDCPNLTLCVHADTPAHKFVQQNNLRFELVEPEVKPAPKPVQTAPKPVQPAPKPAKPTQKSAKPTPKPTPKPAQPATTYAPESHFATAAADGGVSITRYTGPGGEVVIPASIGGKTVVEIGEDAFGDCGKITKMTIPTCVQIIGDHALQSCSGLTYLSIPEGVKQIGNFAFKNCTSLSDVYISESVEKIGTNPFAGCTALKTIRVSDKNMHYNARRSELLMRTIDGFLICCPAGVYRSGTYKLLETVRKIGPFAFQGCTMTRIDINPGVQTIANYAFRECSQLTCVSIPETVRRIGTDAFEHSPRLKLIVPKGSDAHNYARMHGLNYEAVGLISRLFGKK